MGNYTDEQAGNMRGLVKLMRRNLELTEQLCVTMAEELDFVNTFINLEREALGDSFILSTSIDAAIHLDQEILPSMMIQIPIENAIKHALKDKEGMKRLWIDIKKTGEEICVKVRDNGGGYRINSANHGTGTGIKVILQTIQSLMGVDIIKVCSPAEYTRGGITKDAAADSSAFFMKRSMIPSSSFLSIGFSK